MWLARICIPVFRLRDLPGVSSASPIFRCLALYDPPVPSPHHTGPATAPAPAGMRCQPGAGNEPGRPLTSLKFLSQPPIQQPRH